MLINMEMEEPNLNTIVSGRNTCC